MFGIRQVTTVRGREPGDYAMVAFGGAGGLFATEVADFLGIGTVISPPDPGNLCAFGLHVCDVARDYIRTLVRRQSSADADEILAAWGELERLGSSDIQAEGISSDAIAVQFVADVRYFGEGHEVHVEVPEGVSGQAMLDFMWEEFHNVHDRTFGFNYRGQQDVELGQFAGARRRPAEPPADQRDRGYKHSEATPFGKRGVYWRSTGWIDVPLFRRSDLALNQHIAGPAIIEEYGSTIVMPPGLVAARRPPSQFDSGEWTLKGNAMQRHASRRTLGPIELEVIHGTIRAAELEIEAAVERTSRSPMIRDQHDYRVALFDAKGRKLTGRSYSAIVEPVFEYFGRRHSSGRRVFLERSLQFLRRDRARARPLHHRADLLQRSPDRLQPGVRPSRRRRRLGARQLAGARYR